MTIKSIPSIQAKVSISQGTDYVFPEQTKAFLSKTSNNGVCFSGGGTRSLTATMGQLRALQQLNLIENIRYISCVSGGSWACTTFTYYQEGANNDDEFLGMSLTKEQRKNRKFEEGPQDSWASLPPACLGHTATQSFKDSLANYALHDPLDEIWQLAARSLRSKLYENTVASLSIATTTSELASSNHGLISIPWYLAVPLHPIPSLMTLENSRTGVAIMCGSESQPP